MNTMNLKDRINEDVQSLSNAIKAEDWAGVKRCCDAIKGLADDLLTEELYRDDENTPFWQK